MADLARWPAAVAVAGTASLGAAAAVLSFAALCDLAARSGVAVPVLWPAIVDGVVIVATVAVVAGAGRYAWALLIVGALVSVAGNIVHASLPDGVLPVWLRATVAAVPPVALVAVTHLAVRLRRTSSTTSAVARDISILRDDPNCDEALPQSGGGRVESDSWAEMESAVVDPSVVRTALSHRYTTARPHGDTATGTRNDDSGRARAIELLAAGTSARTVAEQLGVHRTTVYRWKRMQCPSEPLRRAG